MIVVAESGLDADRDRLVRKWDLMAGSVASTVIPSRACPS
jgi:hypothetical protein